MTDKQIVGEIDVRIGVLKHSKNVLNFDVEDTTLSVDKKELLRKEQELFQNRIDELERLKKIIYTS